MFSVYLLVCPDDGRVRYVGCSNNPEKRLISHLYENVCSPKKREWIERLRRTNRKPLVFLWQSFTTRKQAEGVERDLISHMPGLYNAMHNCNP